MTSAYHIRPSVLLCGFAPGVSLLRDAPSRRRKTSIAFHVERNDYFGTLATVLGLIADSLENGGAAGREHALKSLADLRDELMYLQSTHVISRKPPRRA